MNTQLEHSKRINATMVTLLQVKNEKAQFAGKPPRASEPKVAEALKNISRQEKNLMKTLNQQMSKLRSQSAETNEDRKSRS